QRGDAERVQIIEVIDHALPVAAVKAAGDRRLDVEVVVGIAVREAIDHDLVDDLVAPVEPGVRLVRLVGGMLEILRAAAGNSSDENQRYEAHRGQHGEHDSCPEAMRGINMLVITVGGVALPSATA